MSASHTPWPMPPSNVSRQASLQAVEWLVRLRDAGDESLKAQWQAWLTADPEHDRAWHYLQASCAGFGMLPAPVAHRALASPAVDAQRRQIAKMLGLGGVAVGAGLLGWRGLPWPTWQADRRTQVGERVVMQWADGIRLDLNTASAVNLLEDRDYRRIELIEGELMVTAMDPALSRPVRVDTVAGSVDTMHGRFSLHSAAGSVRARVFEGAIDVMPAHAPAGAIRLMAGQAVDFSAQGVGAISATSDLDAAWVRGMLVARDMRLDDFLAELARHRPGRLACDPDIAGLRVSGIYPLHDSDRVLDMLARSLPVSVRTFSRYWVVVQPRPTV